MAVRIGELLLKEKLITAEQLQQALSQQKSNGGKLGYNLVKMGFVKDEQITSLLSKQYGVPAISLAQFKIDPTIVKLVPTETARKYQMIPLSRSGSTLTIAMTDPTNVFAMDDIKFMRKIAVARFCRTLSTLISSGVPILDGLEITAKTAEPRRSVLMPTRMAISQKSLRRMSRSATLVILPAG